MKIQQLWYYFKMWIAKAKPDEIKAESAFMCICPDGTGWIGDEAEAVPLLQFDSIEDGIRQLLSLITASAE